eukprot:TRINITY_DN1179_c1_g3_i2.p1 TRINITY_DN1179_c1_g3~~TRINITY_DN1179_c1_g3_i2.p1  ORF type:complete len:498 (-),score=89.86 TRINITY_DN1179_c1_g3_i2:46-1539(-)
MPLLSPFNNRFFSNNSFNECRSASLGEAAARSSRVMWPSPSTSSLLNNFSTVTLRLASSVSSDQVDVEGDKGVTSSTASSKSGATDGSTHTPSTSTWSLETDEAKRSVTVLKLFNKLDVDGDGHITLDDLAAASPSDADLHSLKELFEKKRLLKGDSKGISFGEFYNMLMYDSLPDDNLHDPFQNWVILGDVLISKEEAERPKVPQKSMSKFLVYGALSGAISRTSTAPLERLKILKQIQHAQAGGPQYKGVLDSLIKMWRSEGIAGFFKGNGINCIRIMPSSAIRFWSYEVYKNIFGTATHISNEGRLAAGALSGITAAIATHPLDLVRTRLSAQTTEKKYSGLFGTFMTVYKEEGWRGLYKGLGTSCMGVAPYVALNFAACEGLRDWSRQMGLSGGVGSSLVIGSAGATVAMTCTYPTELLRRRMMMQGAGGSERQYNGIPDAVRKIYQSEGIVGFYRGMGVTYLRVIPSSAVAWAVMDICRKLGEKDALNYIST